MLQHACYKQLGCTALLLVLLATSVGCQAVYHRNRFLEETIALDSGIPRELAKTSLPPYRIEAPDVLLIDAVKVVPMEPYTIEPLDILQILASGTLEGEPPILGEYCVESSGVVVLGPSYGSVRVVGKTLEEAQQVIQEHLEKVLSNPSVAVSLAEPAAKQQIAGEHLVGLDGTVNLGIYGNVYVVDMTVQEARAAIEKQLSKFLQEPEISVDVAAYNSKVYYIVLQGAGLGDQVTRVPITGNETVLDAVSQVGGFTQSQSLNMWIARPSPDGDCMDQVLPINWAAITAGGSTSTNYQILPGDRLYVAEDKMVAFDTWVGRMTAPFERIFGFTLLGTQTVQTINRSPSGFRTGRGGTSINPLTALGFF